MDIPVFSADDEVRRLYEQGGDGQRLLRARFGGRFVPDPDGPVDKPALGAAMREEPLVRREVESLIHPLVRHAARSFWQEQETRGAELAAAEIPLYLETDFGGTGNRRPNAGTEAASGLGRGAPSVAAHVIVGVHCPFSVRQERLMHKRGWSREIIALMESWQWPEDKKMAACDLVIDNTGTERDLEDRAKELVEKLVRMRLERGEQVLARLEEIWGNAEPGSFLLPDVPLRGL